MVRSIRFVDEVVTYDTEADLVHLLKTLPVDIRIIGADWRGREYTGKGLPIEVYFNTRNHGRSTTELRRRVFENEFKKREKETVNPASRYQYSS